jgi:hypothetical protein
MLEDLLAAQIMSYMQSDIASNDGKTFVNK